MKLIEKEIPQTNAEEIESLIGRFQRSELNTSDKAMVVKLLRTVIVLASLLQGKNVTISKLRDLIFGSKTEKSVNADSAKQALIIATTTQELTNTEESKKEKIKGHGHRAITEYPGAKEVNCKNEQIESGSKCPDAGCNGSLYDLKEPVIDLKFTGSQMLAATKYVREVLRCAKCQQRYKAPLPVGISDEKYDATCDATIALMKYAGGLPWYRQGQLQESAGVPMSESVMWERCEAVANAALPVYIMLEKIASRGDVYYVDDTTATILERERTKKYQSESQRKSTYTTGMVIEVGEEKILLYVCGNKHAGENIGEILARRSPDLPPPIQMSDALSSNWKGKEERICAKCLVHARRKFYEIRELYPRQCQIALKAFSKIYKYESETRAMNPLDRLNHHQEHSGPVLERLKRWIDKRLSKGKDEPNSSLGKAMKYFQTHYVELTTFLRVENAPIDNNPAERALKRFVLFRKNSLFFKTDHGAAVGTMLMTLIESCRINEIDPWSYLVALRSKAEEVRRMPEKFLPWNYAQAELLM